MQACEQTQGLSVLDHGLQVQTCTNELLNHLRAGTSPPGWKVPEWVMTHRLKLLDNLVPQHVLDEYTVYHDCGKPYCAPTENHRFPDHARRSYETWLKIGGNRLAAELMLLDMHIHTIKADDVEAFAVHGGAATLMLVGLAEIHANAAMFGGVESQSFRIKWKQIDRRGRAVCRHLFEVRHA